MTQLWFQTHLYADSISAWEYSQDKISGFRVSNKNMKILKPIEI